MAVDAADQCAIGMAAVLLAVRYIAADRPSGPRPRLDFAGAVLATAGLGSLAYGIAQAADDGWSANSTISGIAIGVSLLIAFVVVEKWVTSSPLIPLHIFRNRAVSIGNVIMLLAGACLNPMWYFLTLSMQNVLGYSPVQTGLAFLPHTIVAIAIGGVGGLTPWMMAELTAAFSLHPDRSWLLQDSGYKPNSIPTAVMCRESFCPPSSSASGVEY